jgi:hypothetical protein
VIEVPEPFAGEISDREKEPGRAWLEALPDLADDPRRRRLGRWRLPHGTGD